MSHHPKGQAGKHWSEFYKSGGTCVVYLLLYSFCLWWPLDFGLIGLQRQTKQFGDLTSVCRKPCHPFFTMFLLYNLLTQEPSTKLIKSKTKQAGISSQLVGWLLPVLCRPQIWSTETVAERLMGHIEPGNQTGCKTPEKNPRENGKDITQTVWLYSLTLFNHRTVTFIAAYCSLVQMIAKTYCECH